MFLLSLIAGWPDLEWRCVTDPRCVCVCVCERFTCGRDRSAHDAHDGIEKPDDDDDVRFILIESAPRHPASFISCSVVSDQIAPSIPGQFERRAGSGWN